MGPTELSDALEVLPRPTDPNLLVGMESKDDAGVYKISDEVAIISTVDFITPPVDDPFWFGRISAANSLSDVYAMGGKVLTALNVIMFPVGTLDYGIFRDILLGGQEKINEAGAVMAGGHSVDDKEPKYGLSVTGIVHPDKILPNNTAKPGDALVLTKPIGTGILFNAHRSGKLSWASMEAVLPTIAALNKTSLEVALDFKINACTDITGFGLAGHIQEVAEGSQVDITLIYKDIPLYEDALPMYKKGETTGSNASNHALIKNKMKIATELSRSEIELLVDPQTSGGLLFSLPQADAEALVIKLKAAGIEAASIIGYVREAGKGNIIIS